MAADRLTSALLIGVLVRRASAAGGFAAITVKGDPTSGVILVQLVEKGSEIGLFERIGGMNGKPRLTSCGPAPSEGREAMDQYIARRRRADPDLWIIELDIPDGERFAAETIC